MKKRPVNNAYIDGANLHRALKELGWRLDYSRFRVWLQEKYQVQHAYIFLGMIPKYHDLYTYLNECGYTLIFKEVVHNDLGKPKGNCDADLVLKAVSDIYENKFEKALLVSSDGDYSSLVKFLHEKKAFLTLISPSNKCSFLLRKVNIPIVYLNSLRNKLQR